MPWWITVPLVWHWMTCDSGSSKKSKPQGLSQKWFDKLYQESLPGIKACLQNSQEEPKWAEWAKDYQQGYIIKDAVKKALDANLVVLEDYEKKFGEKDSRTKRAQARRSATFGVYYGVLAEQWSDNLLEVVRLCSRNAQRDMSEAK